MAASNEPAAPAGSLGVAQAADAPESPDERDFLDAPLEVRDFPMTVAEPTADPSASPPSSTTETPLDGTTTGPDAASPEAPIESIADGDGSLLEDESEASSPQGSLESDSPQREDGSASREPLRNGESVAVDGNAKPGAVGDAGSRPSGSLDESTSPPRGDRADGDARGEDAHGENAESASRSGSRIRIEIPQIDVEPIEPRSLRERPEHSIPDDPRWVLRGAWEQTNLRLNGPDFAPGGYDRNLIAIDPEEGILRTYRVYGDGAYVAAGEFRVEIMPNGTLELGVDERRPHLFAAEPFTISGETVTPPSEPIERPRPWSLRDGVLEIDGRRFVRLERNDFEAVARGDAAEADGSAPDGGWAISPAARADVDPAPAVDFFGTSIVGRHICFVVDVSGSMAGPRLAAALGELARSIESLPTDRFFYVLFFSGSKLVLEDRWLRATPSSKRSFNAKLAAIEAQGGTEPSSALEHAFSSLAPVPDEVHFMTDGLIPQGVAELLRNLNAGRVRTVIHTYAFGERASEAMLEAIASEHGGRYRFVPE